ncbi:MAG: trypsin-like peptidase domain-containing protein [Chloroflexi bacterium]|nr:trypsin-like peptidase domain-containing protein [Chloroflexota bacterium]
MLQDPNANQIGNVFADAVERVTPGVVAVHGRKRLPGSGTIWQVGDQAVIVTASHVVEREDQLTVSLDGGEVPATLLGRDLSRDLAVLRVEIDDLQPVTIADPAPRVGTFVMAVGRPFVPSTQASLGSVVFVGSIRYGSYRSGRMIHADPTLYPGFSGGPLIGASGTVYGINTSGASQTGGITIPAIQVSQVAQDIVEFGYVQTAWLGVTVQQAPLAPEVAAEFPEQESGLLVQSVNEGTPAAEVGLQVDDMLVTVDGQPLEDPTDLRHFLCHGRIGDTVTVAILRDTTRLEIVVILSARPEQS